MPMDVAEVAAHARTENFPIASFLFPREYRPHLRAIYGFARLVDLLGDDWDGDRLEVLDELERQLDLCYEGEPEWPVMRELQPTIRACDLPREPFFRLIECNRQDQRVSEYETWADLKAYCTLSADPVGRLVLGVLGLTGDAELVAWSDDGPDQLGESLTVLARRTGADGLLLHPLAVGHQTAWIGVDECASRQRNDLLIGQEEDVPRIVE